MLWHWFSSGCKCKPEGSCPLFLGWCVLMALGKSLLGQEFEQKWWSYLCSQVCLHSWDISSLLAVFGMEYYGTGSALGTVASYCFWDCFPCYVLTISIVSLVLSKHPCMCVCVWVYVCESKINKIYNPFQLEPQVTFWKCKLSDCKCQGLVQDKNVWAWDIVPLLPLVLISRLWIKGTCLLIWVIGNSIENTHNCWFCHK